MMMMMTVVALAKCNRLYRIFALRAVYFRWLVYSHAVHETTMTARMSYEGPSQGTVTPLQNVCVVVRR